MARIAETNFMKPNPAKLKEVNRIVDAEERNKDFRAFFSNNALYYLIGSIIFLGAFFGVVCGVPSIKEAIINWFKSSNSIEEAIQSKSCDDL